ncbi:hypothetical protein ABZP36_008092 [Zizania latifolia]
MAVNSMAASLACAFFFDAEPLGETGRHALDACALCSSPLTRDSDIFMYKGDKPFCSEECRYEQMLLDTRPAGRRQQQYSGSGRTESRRGHQDSRKVSIAS